MSVSISNNTDSVSYSGAGWRLLCGLAVEYGWEPAGTVMYVRINRQTGEKYFLGAVLPKDVDPECLDWVEDRDWCGDYSANDCQQMTFPDALNLAAALKRALVDYSGKRLGEPPFEEWSAEEVVGFLRKAIDFFRGGACMIT